MRALRGQTARPNAGGRDWAAAAAGLDLSADLKGLSPPKNRRVLLKVEAEEELRRSGCRTETKGSGGHSRRNGEWHML